MRLIITRHGETVENALGIIQGHLPGRLSDIGKEQAKKVAKRLMSEKFDYIYSSDLARAADTAREIAQHHPEAKLKFVKSLRERYLGEYEGQRKQDLGYDKNTSMMSYPDPKNGESRKHQLARARRFVTNIIKKHNNDCVLLVGHNGINKALFLAIQGKGLEEIGSVENFKNTSVTIIEINKDRNHKIHLLNCEKHLTHTESK